MRVVEKSWPFAIENADAIEAHWDNARHANPNFFNGAIYLTCAAVVTGDALEAELLRTDFKSYLYWRHLRYPPAGVLDAFGSALIRTSDDKIVVGRQAPGNVNSGLSYPPAGFIDVRDADADGMIDIARSVAREAIEEIGIDEASLHRELGFIATHVGPQVSIAVPFRIPMTSNELLALAERHIASDKAAELEAVVCVGTLADLKGLAMPDYARALLEAQLAPSLPR